MSVAEQPHVPRLGVRFLGLVFALCVGGLLVVIGVPRGTASFARARDLPWLADLAGWFSTWTARLPEFPRLVDWVLLALVGYLGALFLVSLRHWRLSLFALGLGTLVLATVLLHLLAWLGFIAVHVAKFGLLVFGAVSGFFAYLLAPVKRLVGGVAHSVFGSLFGAWAWLPTTIAIAVIVLLTIRYGNKFLRWVGIAIGVVGVIIGLVYLAGLVPTSVWEDVLTVAVVVGLVLLWLLVVATVGQLFLDQLRGTMLAGSGNVGVVMGAIAVGSALAMLMLTGNAFDAYDFYPEGVAVWAHSAVLANSAPQFDAAVAVVVVGLSALGVLSNLFRMRPSPLVRHLGQSLVYTIVGTIVGGAMTAVANVTERN